MTGTIDLAAWVGDVPDAVVEAVRSTRSVLAIGHENPDADTLGASLAVGRIVAALGGSATVICADPPPPIYGFLPDIETVRLDPEPGRSYDLIVVSDCGTLDRIGAIAERHRDLLARTPILVIDHHASNTATGAREWVDPAAAATCEMVALLAVRCGIPLTESTGALATTLMAGIVMDTATFAHPNTTPRTLAVAAALVDAGAPLADISRALYRSKPEAQLRLFGRVLDRLESADESRVVWSWLTSADIAATGALPAHSEGIIDLLSQADRAEVVLLFKEQGDGMRLSVRTRDGGVDATALAGRFGGGGHARAAGATLDGDPVAATADVLNEARRLASKVVRPG